MRHNDIIDNITKELSNLHVQQTTILEQQSILLDRLHRAIAAATSRDGDISPDPEATQPSPNPDRPQRTDTSPDPESVTSQSERDPNQSHTRDQVPVTHQSRTLQAATKEPKGVKASQHRFETVFRRGTRIVIQNKIRTPVNRKHDPTFNLQRERFGTVTHIIGDQIHFITDNNTPTWRIARNLRIKQE